MAPSGKSPGATHRPAPGSPLVSGAPPSSGGSTASRRPATRRGPSIHRRVIFLVGVLALLSPLPDPAGGVRGQSPDDRAEVAAPVDTASVSAVLDAFHDAASKADGERYFGLFAEGGVFIGTDPTERWTLDEFREYARPFFRRGQGWTYVPGERHVRVSPDGSTAWFDELLHNEGLGLTRGTGVLLREGGSWKVAQYHLTIPVPNAVAEEVVRMIREREGR